MPIAHESTFGLSTVKKVFEISKL